MNTLRPKVVIPLINNKTDYKGALASVLSKKGSSEPDDVKQWMAREGMSGFEVAGPQEFGQALDVQLENAPAMVAR